MSFVHTKEDIQQAHEIAEQMTDIMCSAPSPGVALDAMMNLFTSYILVFVENAELNAEQAALVVDDFQRLSKERLARDLPKKAVH